MYGSQITKTETWDFCLRPKVLKKSVFVNLKVPETCTHWKKHVHQGCLYRMISSECPTNVQDAHGDWCHATPRGDTASRLGRSGLSGSVNLWRFVAFPTNLPWFFFVAKLSCFPAFGPKMCIRFSGWWWVCRSYGSAKKAKHMLAASGLKNLCCHSLLKS